MIREEARREEEACLATAISRVVGLRARDAEPLATLALRLVRALEDLGESASGIDSGIGRLEDAIRERE